MNNKLKREFNRLKIANKQICVKVCAGDYNNETALLDAIASVLERGIRFIQLEQGIYKDDKFLEQVRKVTQLTSIYDATLVIRGNIAVSYFAEPDGVVLSLGDLRVKDVKELLGNERIIGYYCEDETTVKQSIKSGVDYIIFSTPSTSTIDVVIEYAKWVYENTETPLFLEVESTETYATLKSANIDKFICSIKLIDSILHTP